MKIKKFNSFLNERSEISLVGKKVYADDKLLKTATLKEVGDNILFYHEDKGNFMFGKDKTFLYFTDSKNSVKKLANGEIDFLFFPIRTRFNSFTVAPIDDVWKIKHTNKFKGSEHILGIFEGFCNEKTIYVDMMSVRPKYQHNKINSFMLDLLQKEYPKAKLIFEDPTDQGYLFIKKYSPDAEIRWRSDDYRAKEWIKDHPEENEKRMKTKKKEMVSEGVNFDELEKDLEFIFLSNHAKYKKEKSGTDIIKLKDVTELDEIKIHTSLFIENAIGYEYEVRIMKVISYTEGTVEIKYRMIHPFYQKPFDI